MSKHKGFTVTIEGKPGSWYVRWSLTHERTESGRPRRYRSAAITMKADAESLAGRMREELTRQAMLYRSKNGAMGLGDVLDRWRTARLADDPPISAQWADECVERMKRIAMANGWQTTADITHQAVRAWLEDPAGKDRSMGRRIIPSILRWAACDLHQPCDPAALHPVKRRGGGGRKPDRRPLPAGIFRALIHRAQTLGPQVEALVHYLATYGCRPVTAGRMLVSDYDPERRWLLVRSPKQSDSFSHALTARTVELFDQIVADRRPTDPLFLSPISGKAWAEKRGRADEMASWYRLHVSNQPGVPDEFRGIYWLKRHAITSMLRSGIPRDVIRKYTGHKSDQSLDAYEVMADDATMDYLDRLPQVG